MPKDPHTRLRFAPSPTGALHIGGARTALYNWLAARHEGGELVLRIEDTDRERSTAENVEQILDALRWLELDWDEGPVSQVSRSDRHEAALASLLESGAAYRDTATAKEVEAWKAEHGADRGYRGVPGRRPAGRGPPACARRGRDRRRGPDPRPGLLPEPQLRRLRHRPRRRQRPLQLRGRRRRRRDGDHRRRARRRPPLEHAKAAARPRRPRSRAPRYAHLPLLHGPDGRKLSKRHGAASVQELREGGYLPAAVRNYLALLGWGADDDATLISTAELVERFRVEDVGSAAAIFDEKKLRWVNGRYMRELPLDEYTAAVAAHTGREADKRLRAACEIAQDKAQTLDQVWPLIGFLFEPPVEDEAAWRKVMKDGTLPLLEAAREALAAPPTSTPPRWRRRSRRSQRPSGSSPGRLYQPIRVAITGTTVSPGIFESLAVLGREQALERIDSAVRRLRLNGQPAA